MFLLKHLRAPVFPDLSAARKRDTCGAVLMELRSGETAGSFGTVWTRFWLGAGVFGVSGAVCDGEQVLLL